MAAKPSPPHISTQRPFLNCLKPLLPDCGIFPGSPRLWTGHTWGGMDTEGWCGDTSGYKKKLKYRYSSKAF